MYLYVELWNVTQKWMDLSKEERRQYMKKVKENIAQMSKGGVENVGWALNDEHTPHRSDYRYIAVWKVPALEHVEQFEQGLEDADWHKYFSQRNARGKVIPIDNAIDFLIDLEEHSTSLIE